MRLRPVLINVCVLASTLLLCLLAIEAWLRVSDSSWERQRRLYAEGRASLHYLHAAAGYDYLAPQQVGRHRTACTDTRPVSVDHEGFRGASRRADSAIVILGDSFAEGLHVPDGLTLADRLEAVFGEPVLNAGVSGYATSHALIAWRERLRPKQPRLVILALYLGNDISGNSCKLSRTEPPCGEIKQGKASLSMERLPPPGAAAMARQDASATPRPGPSILPQLRHLFRKHLALYALGHDVRLILQGLTTSSMDPRWGMYRRTVDVDWAEAWAVTEYLLARLKEETRAAGATLVLLSIPEFLALAPDPSRLVRFGSGSRFPEDFEAALPSQRLMNIAANLDIPALDLLPVFTSYRDRHRLPPPYFSFSCDGHWNPLGHAIAAEALANFVVRHGLVDAPSPASSNLMDVAPRSLLGEVAYAQIYSGGIYRPETNSTGNR